MVDPKALDDLTRRVFEALPEGIEQVHEDLRKNIRAVLSAALTRMDLVSREEFDVQSAVLARTRAKVTELEKKVADLERELLNPQPRTRTPKT